MGTLNGIDALELRIYDDPKNPNSPYTLLSLASLLQHVYDEATGISLDKILAGLTNFGTCATAAATAAKTVSLPGFTLRNGARATIKFSNANTATSPTLNIEGSGAKQIFYRGQRLTTLTNGVYDFIFTGTNYEPVGSIPGYGY